MHRRTAAWALSALALACANHVRTVEHEDERERVSVLEVEHSFESPQDVVRTPRLHVALAVEETLETQIERTIITVDESTPYSAWRELYEVPVGVASLPLAFLLQAGDAVTLGLLPDDVVDGYSDWTVSGLNPALNTESSARVERVQISREVRPGAPVRTVVRRPLAHHPVEFNFDGGAAAVAHTDRGGHAVVHMLKVASAGLPAPPRKIRIRVPETGLERELFLDRRLSSRIWQARPWLQVLEGPEPTPGALVEAISAIDQLGFPGYSLQAEDSVHSRFAEHSEFLLAFRRQMERASPRAAPPVSTARPPASGRRGSE